jgi:hypothetical protein
VIRLPLQQTCRNALRFGHAIAVEAPKLGQTSLSAPNAIVPLGRSLRGQLAFESALLFAREIASSGSKVRIMTHPIGGEITEKVIYILFRLSKDILNPRGKSDCTNGSGAQQAATRHIVRMPHGLFSSCATGMKYPVEQDIIFPILDFESRGSREKTRSRVCACVM